MGRGISREGLERQKDSKGDDNTLYEILGSINII